MNREKKSKIIAIAATAAVFALLVTWLAVGTLSVKKRGPHEWPPERHSEIVFETPDDEFKYVPTLSDSADNAMEEEGDDSPAPSSKSSDEPTQTTYNAADAGSKEGSATPPKTSGHESPVKLKEADRPAGNRRPNPEDERAAEAVRRQKSRKNIDDKAKNAFGSGASKGEGKRSENDADGTAAAPGKGEGKGLYMIAPVDRTPRSTFTGQITVECTVMADGTVRDPKIKESGTNIPAEKDPNLRARCLSEARNCRFSRPSDAQGERPGTIVFRWADKN